MAISIRRSHLRSPLPMSSPALRHVSFRSTHRIILSRAIAFHRLTPPPSRLAAVARVRAFSTIEQTEGQFQSAGDSVAGKVEKKPSICTADELHYVSVNNSDWRLALWRYHPSPQAQPRNHPLLLLSGVGTNAIGYDLSPESSFARHMSGQGFDTWILEVRGAGLSMHGSHSKEIEHSAHEISEKMQAAVDSAADGGMPAMQQTPDAISASRESDVSVTTEYLTEILTVWDKSKLVTTLTETFIRLSERLSGFLSEGQSKIISAKLLDQIARLFEHSFVAEPFNEIRGKLLSLVEKGHSSAVGSQIKELSQKLVNVIEEGQRSVSPQLFDLQERLTTTIEDFQKQLDLIVKYDWDFDHYLEEDVPAAMEYIKAQTQPNDGNLLAVGHSMGGILLYAMVSRCCSDGRESGLAAIATLASSVNYTSSNSSLKLLLPLAEPAQALNVPVVPLGALMTAAYPLTSRPPYVLSWLNHMISAQDMMHPDLLKKLVLNNFCTIPAKLLLQLRTAFREHGLSDRSGTFFYKDHLHKLNIPVLALAGDRDAICPPEAVQETVKLIPKNLVTYKLFGEPEGPHYAHYDLVGGRMAVDEIYPCIIEFLNHHDST